MLLPLPRDNFVAPPFDVLGIGLNATDTLILVPHFPAYAGKTAFEREILSPGGQVTRALVACAKLGLNTKYIGTVGDDERGRVQLDTLRMSGINVDDVEVRAGCPNQSAYIIIDQSTGERTVFWKRDERLRLSPASLTREMISSTRLCTSMRTTSTLQAWLPSSHASPASRLPWMSTQFTKVSIVCSRMSTT